MKTRIPIKKYTPDERVLANVNTVLASEYGPDDPIRIITEGYLALERHHEEETKFLIQRIGELELLATD